MGYQCGNRQHSLPLLVHTSRTLIRSAATSRWSLGKAIIQLGYNGRNLLEGLSPVGAIDQAPMMGLPVEGPL